MSSPDGYTRYVRGWETNEGGVLIDDPRLRRKIIPELEHEEIRLGSFPHIMADVLPSMFLDIATITTVWDEKHIAVARMIMTGVTKTPFRKSKQALAKLQAEGTKLKHEDYFSSRTFLSYLTGIYTRDILDKCIQQMKNDHVSSSYSLHGRSVRVTGCTLFIHSRTD